jgi:hypothetical protein
MMFECNPKKKINTLRGFEPLETAMRTMHTMRKCKLGLRSP